MQIVTVFRLVIIVTSVVVVGVGPAYSQGAAPRRPAGGLFGANRSDVAAAADRLNFTFILAEGLESAVPPDLASRVSRELQSGGFSTQLAAAWDYARTGKRLNLASNASTAFKYYQSLDRFDALGHNLGVGANIRLPNGSVQLNQSAAYSPSYLYQLFPTDSSPILGESIPINPEYQIVDTESFVYSTTARLSFGSVRGTQFTASGTFSHTDFEQQAFQPLDLDSYHGGVEVARRITSSGRFIAGYDFHSGEFGLGGVTTEHGVTIGAEWSPALSRTRRVTLRLDVTPSRLELPASALNGLSAGEADLQLNRLSSEASITYPFRPNWQTTARYRRSVEYLSVLGQPVLSDGGRLELTGLPARRIDLTASAGYVAATSALSSTQALVTYTGQVAIRYALKRSLALSAEYLYYYYDLSEQAGLAPHLSPTYEQHGVRVGVVLFVETLGR